VIGTVQVKYVNSWLLCDEHTDSLGEKRTPVILLSDYRAESDAYIKLHSELTTLRQQLAEMQALAYYYPPTAPFALDGVTWKQRAEEAERKLENPDIEKVARVFHDAYEDAALRHGWKTQDSCRVPFESLPAANKAAMLTATQSAIEALEGMK